MTFKQIVIAPQPTAAARRKRRASKPNRCSPRSRPARDFEKIAKRESMDLADEGNWRRYRLGASRRERAGVRALAVRQPLRAPLAAWSNEPGRSRRPFGYHIIRVDRVQPGEVKARPDPDRAEDRFADVARAQKLADSVAALWKGGAPFDSLAKKYHDYAGKEETSILTPWVRDSLPASYQKAFLLHKAQRHRHVPDRWLGATA